MQQTRTVFLVDDDLDDQEIFSTALGRADKSINCVFANDGIDAMQKINNEWSFVPDLIFIDLNMPRMNGQECLSNIKKIDRLKNVPVYIYSTSGDPDSIAANKELGAVDFIVKPPDIYELTQLLSKIISRKVFLVCLALTFFTSFSSGLMAQKKSLPPVATLKKLSVEELMNIEVTSVSKTPEKITEVASAIQVLTGEDIRRSPTTLLPDVLRLAPNLQVARAGAHDWSVTSRGFNGAPVANSSLSNKLLVMIDGRTVYNPLFGGVYWDVQSLIKDNIDRIEVISGPGGTLWGANAVNGVINIITKNAKETQGLSISGAYGSYLNNGFSARYGSHIDSTFFFRVMGQRYSFNNSNYKDSISAGDEWNMTRGGFRMDYMPSAKNHFTLQGDIYGGNEDRDDSTEVEGQNIVARWTHVFSERSNLSIQTYFDRTFRNIKTSPLTNEINTFDVDMQHHFMPFKNNRITWGVNYRVLNDNTVSNPATITPAFRKLELFSGFLQDQISLVPNRLEFTIGTKLQHNDYTDFEWQPSGRLAWTPTVTQTIWTAISRAVRTPTRLDAELTSFTLAAHPAFRSENVFAYEIGYRTHPIEKLSFSIAGFYNRYTDLRSVDLVGTPPVSVFGNNLKAQGFGIELSGNYVITNRWRIRGGYTFLYKEFQTKANNVLPGTELIEAIDPKHQALVQSILDLPKNFEVDVLARYVDKLPDQSFRTTVVPAYFSLDFNIGWSYKFLSLGVCVQNATDGSHLEFGNREIPRHIYGKIGFRF